MPGPDNHYRFLGLGQRASEDEIEAQVERLSKQANAIENTSPESAREIRERLRRISGDLLSGSEQRDAYDASLMQAQREAARDRGIRLDGVSGKTQTKQAADDAPRPTVPREDAGRISIPTSWQSSSGAQTRSGYDLDQTTPQSMPRPPSDRSATQPLPTVPQYRTSPREAWKGVAPPSPRRSSTRWVWLALALVLVALGAGAGAAVFARTHGSTPTPTPTITPTPKPTPNLTATQVAIENMTLQDIRQTVETRNAHWLRSMDCACDDDMASVETGAALADDQQDIAALQAQNGHWVSSGRTLHFNSVRFHGANASVQVHVDEVRYKYTQYTLTRKCDGGYQQGFHLISSRGTWKVDSRQDIAQYCQQVLPTPTLLPATVIPTPTPLPTATPAPTSSDEADVEQAVIDYAAALKIAAGTSDCSEMYAVAVDPELHKEQGVCNMDRATNVHKEIADLDPPVFVSVNISSDGSSATAVVRKHQEILFIHNRCGVPDDENLCGADPPANTLRDTRYTAEYSLTKGPLGHWFVDLITVTS